MFIIENHLYMMIKKTENLYKNINFSNNQQINYLKNKENQKDKNYEEETKKINKFNYQNSENKNQIKNNNISLEIEKIVNNIKQKPEEKEKEKGKEKENIEKNESKESKEEEQKVIFFDEEKSNTDNNDSSSKISNEKEKEDLIINEKPIIKNDYFKTYAKSRPISKSIDNNYNLKNIEKSKINLINKNKIINNQNHNNFKNIKKINIKNNKQNKLLNSDIVIDKKFQTFKQNDLYNAKTIFSLYDYLQSNRVSKYFNNNKTEIDTSNIKIKNNTNIGVLQYNSKNPLKKELFYKKN